MRGSDLTQNQRALLSAMSDGEVYQCRGREAHSARSLHLYGLAYPEGYNLYRISEAGREALSRVRSRQGTPVN